MRPEGRGPRPPRRRAIRRAAVAAAALAVLAAAQGAGRRGAGPGLRLTYPPEGLVTGFTRVRIAGGCDPSSRATVRGEPVRVYPTGAFVALVPLAAGENVIEVAAEKGGRREAVRRTVICRDPAATSPVSPLTIDARPREPSVDTVLGPGDELAVRVKGSPGMRGSWSLAGAVLDAPLVEAPPAAEGELRGVAGIYAGTYAIRGGERAERGRVRFRLVSPAGETVEASSAGRVTIHPVERLARGEVGPGGAAVRREPDGARLWSLDPGARVTICGEAGDQYRLRLSGRERAWAPKDAVRRVKGRGGWEETAAGAPRVDPSAGGARLVVPVAAAVPFRLTQDEGGTAWVLDVFGAAGAPPFSLADGPPPLGMVEASSAGEGVVSVRAAVRGTSWGCASGRTDEGIALVFRPPPGRGGEPVTVVLDPGHGGAQDGAVSPTGLKEKDVNLEVARAAAAALAAAGARPVLTRDGDATRSLAERIETARSAGADLFVSIHHNSRPGHADPLSRRGADAFYAVPQSAPLARRILAELGRAGVATNECRREGFAVILPTDFPAVLVECAYLSHPGDEEMVLHRRWPGRAGGAIARGIMAHVREEG
ncbi:MAG: N-acetylmuramoyl-L-alanine amidase [bacterium]|nr:N-acetylmuramoyl-L-alanine amidase [bacterium]